MYKIKSKRGFDSSAEAINFLLSAIAESGLETEFEVVLEDEE